MKARKQGTTTYPIVFLMVDANDHITGKTGLTPTVTISKNGGAFTAAAGTVTEIGHGWYAIGGHTTDRNTLGELIIHAEAPGADPVDERYEIASYDPFLRVNANTEQWNSGTLPAVSTLTEAGVRSAVGLASANLDAQLANLPTAVNTTMTTAHGSGSWTTATGFSTLTAQQVWQYATRTLTAFSFSVTVGANNDKTGYALTSAYDAAKTASQAGDQMALTASALSSVRSGLSTFNPATDKVYLGNGAHGGAAASLTLSNYSAFKATGFATPSDLAALQTHGDSNWTTATGFATSAALAAIGDKVEAILEDTSITGVVMAGYTAPDNEGIAAIKAQTDKLAFVGGDVKATLDGEKVAATLAAGDVTGNLPALVNGYAAGLDPVAIDLGAIVQAVDQQLTESHGEGPWVAAEVDLSEEFAAIKTHGDANWTTATGFATRDDLQALQAHGDEAWASTDTSGLATSDALVQVATAVEAMQQALASGVLVAGESVLAIREGLSTFNPSQHGVMLTAQQPAYAPAKAGDPMALAAEERGAVATAMLDLADGIEANITLRDAIRIIAAAVAGLLSGAGTDTERFKGLDKVTTRLTVRADEKGNRTEITYHK